MAAISKMLDEIRARTVRVNVTYFSKVGNGKSSSANTMLAAWLYQGEGFAARRQRGAVTEKAQTIEHARDGVTLRAIDQPGLLDARGVGMDEEHLRHTALSKEHADGYHVLNIVQKITDRLDASEQIILGAIRRFYGDAATDHICLLLTHADTLDTAEEIERMVAEAKADVEKELGYPIAAAIAVNNHVDKIAPNGQTRVTTGEMMIGVVRDIVVRNHQPFKPPPVPAREVRQYVEEESKKRGIKFEDVFKAVVSIIPILGSSSACTVL